MVFLVVEICHCVLWALIWDCTWKYNVEVWNKWPLLFYKCGHRYKCPFTAVWQTQAAGVLGEKGSWLKDCLRGAGPDKWLSDAEFESWIRTRESRRGAWEAETLGPSWRKEDPRWQKWSWCGQQDCPHRGGQCWWGPSKEPVPEEKAAQGGLSAGVHTPHKPDLYSRRECLACPFSTLTWLSLCQHIYLIAWLAAAAPIAI